MAENPSQGGLHLQVKRNLITLISQLECTCEGGVFSVPWVAIQVRIGIGSFFDIPEGEVEDRIVLFSFHVCYLNHTE